MGDRNGTKQTKGRRSRRQLKGWVLLGRTVNVGKFNSVRIELGTEFPLAEASHEETVNLLRQKLESAIRSMGLVQRYD